MSLWISPSFCPRRRRVVRTSIDSYNGDEPVNAEQINIWKCGDLKLERDVRMEGKSGKRQCRAKLNTRPYAEFLKNKLKAEIRTKMCRRHLNDFCGFFAESGGTNSRDMRVFIYAVSRVLA